MPWPSRDQLVAQLAEILDDAVVDDGDAVVGGVRMRVASVGAPCVAQRVWPMPICRPSSGSATSSPPTMPDTDQMSS
jgi:hypothetical protein